MPRAWWTISAPGIVWIVYAIIRDFPIKTITFPTYAFMGIIYVWTGFVIYSSYKFIGLGKKITAGSFVLWGLYKLYLPILGEESWLTPWGYMISWLAPWGFLVSMLMTMTAAVGILLMFFGKIGIDLQNSEKRFRLLAENARDAIYRVNIKPHLDLEYISNAVASIIGYLPTELYMKKSMLLKLIHPEDKGTLKSLLRNPKKQILTLRWINKSGTIVWTEHNNVPIFDKNGHIVAIEGIARDISERKRAEMEMLKARERMARAEKMASIGAIAAGITHEINQPLNSLKVTVDGMIYFHKKQLLDMEEIVANLESISKQVDRIDSIVKHVRSFVRPQTSSKNVLTDLNKAVNGGLELVSAQLLSHSIKLRKNLDPNLPLIRIDSVHVEQIVSNLVTNSRQALDQVKRDEKEIVCRTCRKDDFVVLEVQDNGPGIGQEIKDEVLDPFFTTRNSGDCMGLGLSIVNSIVHHYKGKINISDAPGGGTAFSIYFRLDPTETVRTSD